MTVPDGGVYGFLGPNGAGKSTIMRLIVGLLRPSAGTVSLFGENLAQRPRALLGQVGILIESHGLYEHLTGRENLLLACRLRGIDRRDIGRVLDAVAMHRAADRAVKTYSLGMKQRTALARALLGRPRLVVLDEPTNGLDPEGIMAMRDLIRELPARFGATVLLSSHLLGEVQEVADHIGLLRQGELVAEGPLRALSETEPLIAISTDRQAEARTALLALGLEEDRDSAEERLVFRMGRLTAAQINRSLVEGGFAVSALAQESRGLERLYRDKLGSQPSFEAHSVQENRP
ncbi:MAG TPA: ABC transporter ATP-binding protein [Brevundimonas sp.]|nr:ABC transporter ATP-binding protein [Citromicrobium sp.]MAO96516.1 ABC transporter ATP-binding protein [Citromicrobium sp.]MBD76852.1 ABC transporter ATP-binding protein [Citromicrobium sp.]MBT47479.1 ABC transporter ATP-binding protein [Citromicrobium sp.]HAV50753.1 ABC transporter ATP-binding protein [Brevundimonas sp.]